MEHTVDLLVPEHIVFPLISFLLKVWYTRHFYLTCSIFMFITMIFNPPLFEQQQQQLAFKFEL